VQSDHTTDHITVGFAAGFGLAGNVQFLWLVGCSTHKKRYRRIATKRL
jgi:hypothetical protein